MKIDVSQIKANLSRKQSCQTAEEYGRRAVVRVRERKRMSRMSRDAVRMISQRSHLRATYDDLTVLCGLGSYSRGGGGERQRGIPRALGLAEPRASFTSRFADLSLSLDCSAQRRPVSPSVGRSAAK